MNFFIMYGLSVKNTYKFLPELRRIVNMILFSQFPNILILNQILT